MILATLPGNNLKSDAEWFAEQIKLKYLDLPKSAKKLLLTVLRSKLPPESRPGRPPRADVTEALRLETEGYNRTEVYRRLKKHSREEQRALRESMRQRKARRRRRTEITGTIDIDNGQTPSGKSET